MLRNETIFRRLRRSAAARRAILLIACSGCSKAEPPAIVPAQGVVLINGAPLSKAQVRFIPMIGFGPEYIATGVTDDEGNFELTCQGQSGACAAEHAVTVSETDIPSQFKGEDAQAELAGYLKTLKNRPIPKNYATPVQTPLKVTVSAAQANYKLELQR
jgi:hypothetical protein